MNVSGAAIDDTLFSAEPKGAVLLSGGEFGAEGSLISTLISIVFIILLVRSKWLKPAVFRSALWRRYPAGCGIEPEDAGDGRNTVS
jgi:hypothetical protein